MTSSNTPINSDLLHQRNDFWRNIARYKQEVLPLYLRLEHVDRQKQLAPFIAYWECIPMLAKVAQRQIDDSLAFFRKVYLEMHEREKSTAPDTRKYLADKLRGISLILGNGEIRQANPAAEWKPDWELAQLLGDPIPAYIQTLSPESVGQLLAKIDYFWQCWHDFHEAERISDKPAFSPSQLATTSYGHDRAPHSPWEALLIGSFSLSDLFDFFADCGLLTPTGDLTTLGRGDVIAKARKAPWVGALQALIINHQIDSNTAGICRALADPAGKIGVSLNEGTLRQPSKKSEPYQIAAAEHLEKRVLLRK